MFRLTKLSEFVHQKDWLGMFVVALGAIIACWAVSILFSQTTRELAMRRFQLASPSFTSWAAISPVPAMYNFENRVQFTNELAGSGPLNESHDSWFENPVNHFPARCMTFGDFASQCFAENRQGTFEMSTRFRGTELISRWEITENSDGVMTVRRVSEDWMRHDVDE